MQRSLSDRTAEHAGRLLPPAVLRAQAERDVRPAAAIDDAGCVEPPRCPRHDLGRPWIAGMQDALVVPSAQVPRVLWLATPFNAADTRLGLPEGLRRPHVALVELPAVVQAAEPLRPRRPLAALDLADVRHGRNVASDTCP